MKIAKDHKNYNKVLAWQQFYGLILAFYFRMFHVQDVPEIVVLTFIYRPKALGDIRGVSYIYGLFYRFGLIDVPDKAKEKMGGKEH